MTKKNIRKGIFSSPLIWLTAAFLTAVIFGLYTYRSSLTSVGINEIGVLTPTYTGVIQPLCNKNNLKDISASEPCGLQSFRKITFHCEQGSSTRKLGDDNSCKTLVAWQKLATQTCPNVCPSPKPTPVASCRPRPACLDAKPACKLPQTEDMCPPNTSPKPTSSCRPRPACLDSNPRCLLPETEDMCPPSISPRPLPTSTPLPRGCYTSTAHCPTTFMGGTCQPKVICP